MWEGAHMKLLVIGDERRFEQYLPDLPIVGQTETLVVSRGASDDEILSAIDDCDFIVADAISPVSARLISSFPSLKLVHSEGVAYNAIDLTAARERGVVVCNCARVNAGAVAEHAILLMLACLRYLPEGDESVREGSQIKEKERLMIEGVRELGDCSVGLIGFGSIAAETAKRLHSFGCDVAYWNRNRRPEDIEDRFHVRYLPFDDLISTNDIISLHVPSTPETEGLIGAEALSAMKKDAVLINTARGEIIDQHALADALERGSIGFAGLDTLSPEPVTHDHPLINLTPAAARRIVLSPHIGGITEGAFRRAWQTIWTNIARVSSGETPANIVS